MGVTELVMVPPSRLTTVRTVWWYGGLSMVSLRGNSPLELVQAFTRSTGALAIQVGNHR